MLHMDAYCERTAPGLLNEPLNAITNSSFLIAAWFAWFLVTARGSASRQVSCPHLAFRLRRYRERPMAHAPERVDVTPSTSSQSSSS